MAPLIGSRHIAGIEIVYINNQPVHPANIPVFVFIHGMWDGTKIFTSWLEECVRSDNQAYAVTLETGRKTSFNDYVEHVERAVKIIGKVGPIVLVGYSLGGLIAQAVASRNPFSVRGIVLVASAPPKGIQYLPLFWFKLRYVKAVLGNSLWTLGRADAMEHVLNRIDAKEAERIYAEFRPESGKVLWELARGISVEKIRSPILIIAGEYDRLLPLKEVQSKLYKRYGMSDFRIFPVGHLVPVEDKSGEIIRLILNWGRSVVPKRTVTKRSTVTA